MTTAGTTSKSHVFAVFAAGVAAGVLVYKFWPKISGVLKPYATSLSQFGKQKFGGNAERFSDVISEIKSEENAKNSKV